MKEDVTGRTSTDAGHSHSFNVDANGNGSTGRTDGHIHRVANWVVSIVNRHRHTIAR